MLAIGHFAFGVSCALLLLILREFKNELRFDLFAVILAGLWAILPDVSLLWGWGWLDEHMLADVFFLHHLLDYLPDIPIVASYFIGVSLLLLIFYFYQVRNKSKATT